MSPAIKPAVAEVALISAFNLFPQLVIAMHNAAVIVR
jgi:hypothetical protein